MSKDADYEKYYKSALKKFTEVANETNSTSTPISLSSLSKHTSVSKLKETYPQFMAFSHVQINHDLQQKSHSQNNMNNNNNNNNSNNKNNSNNNNNANISKSQTCTSIQQTYNTHTNQYDYNSNQQDHNSHTTQSYPIQHNYDLQNSISTTNRSCHIKQNKNSLVNQSQIISQQKSNIDWPEEIDGWVFIKNSDGGKVDLDAVDKVEGE
ncbi:hypothetical protein C2G38_2162029 [Gigaspora rosea]|uniref:Uncharacterized protein n=1 Tax=Gigaspora rosea TaxID=44941 RepID=A0A397VWD0_9GLOM|nr:hypothetical protein C2G38_2162029 [Gigaspora rosea]